MCVFVYDVLSYTLVMSSSSLEGNEPIRTDAVNYIGRHNLFFFNLQPEDAGTYICTVTNKETALSVLSKARLTVHGELYLNLRKF